MDDIKTMSDKFNTIDEKQIYINALNNTITKQSKRINELEKEITELKKELLSKPKLELTQSINPIPTSSDEETICVVQLRDLRAKAMEGELTLEEVKKVDIFVKTLMSIRNKPKKSELPIQSLTSDELHSELNKLLSGDIVSEA